MSSTKLVTSSLVTYPSHQVDDVWPLVAPLINRAVEQYPGRDGFTLDRIRDALLAGEFQLWTCQSDRIEAAVVTAIIGDSCRLIVAGGEAMNTWVKWLPLVEDFARDNGCEYLTIYGRRGWMRAAGFKEVYTKMERKL